MRYLLGLFMLLTASMSNAELAVVAGQGFPLSTLSKHEVADIFLAKTTHLADGLHVKPFELNNAGYKALFYREISGKTLSQINSYWTTLIFTGKGKPPKNIEEPSRLIELLNNDPSSIAYLPTEKITNSMKVLHVFH